MQDTIVGMLATFLTSTGVAAGHSERLVPLMQLMRVVPLKADVKLALHTHALLLKS
jgi:hypothetical protein